MMKIVSFRICPFVQRVTALLAAKDVKYDIEYINLYNKPDWFLQMSPYGQVPILIVDDGRVLFESDAIIEYVDEAEGESFFAKDIVEKAQDRAWSYLASKNYLVQCSFQRSPDEATSKKRMVKLSWAFDKITTRFRQNNGLFAHGNKIGAIDIAWLPILHRAALIKERTDIDYLKGFSALQDWQQALLATDIPDKSVSEDFKKHFADFYLAESSYFGQIARQKQGQSCDHVSGCSPSHQACCA